MSYASERAIIKAAFKSGMDIVYKTMFTETLNLYLLDEAKTTTNIYGETSQKVYKSPYAMTAKVVTASAEGDNEVQTIQDTVVITFPFGQFEDKSIPCATDKDLITLQKALIKYKGFIYLVDKVLPKTQVADTFLFYEFDCTKRDKDSSMTYVLPEV